MITHSQRRALDRRLGAELGFNPHGQPNFRWVHTTEQMLHIKHGDGLHRRASGVMVWDKKFEAKPWSVRYGDCWILAKWRHYTREEWYGMVKHAMPYPEKGEYVPCENIKLGPQYPEFPREPNLDATLDAIYAVKYHRTKTVDDFLSDPQRAHELVIKGITDKIGEELHDMIPAFGKEPGTHSGSTEFQS